MRIAASRPTFVLIALAFAFCAAACASESGGEDVVLDAGALDAASGPADAAQEPDATDAGAAADAAATDAAAPELPPCTLACDRVVDCAAESCTGIEWRTAGMAYTACAQVCGDLFAERILEALDCDEVMSHARRQSAELVTLCEADICELACDHLADCVIEACPNFYEVSRPDITADCVNDCKEEDSGDMLSVSCEDLMNALSAQPDAEQFLLACYEPETCASEEQCIPYAEKVSGCLVEQCNGNADAFAEGLQEAFLMFCLDPQQCVTNTEARFILGDEVTCDGPELGELGADPAFAPICTGSVGASYEELVSVCNALAGCGIDLGPVARCAMAMAMDSSTASMAACIGSATGCLAILACLGGP